MTKKYVEVKCDQLHNVPNYFGMLCSCGKKTNESPGTVRRELPEET